MANKEANIKVIVIDDITKTHSPLIALLGEEFEHVILFNTPDEGLEYIGQDTSSKTIVILDIDFGDEYINGYEAFDEIRKKSFLIEVILYTARDNSNEFQKKIEEVIGNRAFAYVVKNPNKMDNLLEAVRDAREKILMNVEVALEEWLVVKQRDKRKDKSYDFYVDDKKYSLEEALVEIRKQSVIGQKIEREINMLAIDLLMQKKDTQ